MSVILTNDLSVDFKDLKGKSFENIYAHVGLQNGKTQTVKLTEIFDVYNRPYFVDNEIADPQKNFDNIVFNPSRYHLENGVRLTFVDDKPIVVAQTKATKLTTANDRRVFGLNQTIGVAQSERQRYTSITKVFVKLKGDKNYILVDAKDVFVLHNGVSTKLSDLTDQTILDQINNEDVLNDIELVVFGRSVDEMDKTKFEQLSVVEQEDFKLDDQNGKTMLLHKNLGEDYKAVNDGVVKKSFAENDGTKVVRSSLFSIVAEREGDHVYVENMQGQKMFVNLADLFVEQDGKKQQIDLKAFATIPDESNLGYLDFVGKNLFLKQGENFIELQPLSAENATKVFANKTISFTPTTKAEDIAQPGVYRQAKDGRYFEESKIQPFCYDYTEGKDDFSHYLFVVNTNAGERTIIVPKTEFANNRRSFKINLENTAVELNLDGYNKPRTLKRVNKSVNKCAVVQTTNVVGAKFSSAAVIKLANSDELVDNETTTAIYNQFLKDYGVGEYPVDKVFNDADELVELSGSLTRYKLTDYVEENDSTAQNTFYDNFTPATLTLVNGKFRGRPTFSRKKANKKYTKKALNLAKSSITLAGTPIGILTLFAAPVLPVVAAGAVLSIPVARVVNAVRAAASKRSVSNSIKNPVEVNREHEQDKVSLELQNYIKQIEKQWQIGQNKALKQQGKNAYYTLTPNEMGTMLEKFRLLQEKVELSFSAELATGGLHVVDGVAQINGQNAYLAKEYEKLLKDKNKSISKLKRQILLAKGNVKISLQNQLEDLIVERDVMLKDFTISHPELTANQKAKDNCLNLINLARGMMIAKYNDYPILSDEEQRIVNSIKVDFVSGKVKFEKKLYKSVDELIKARPEVKQHIDSLIEQGKAFAGAGHLDINNREIVIEKPKTEPNLVEKRAEELQKEKSSVVEAEQNKEATIIQKLIKKLEAAKQNQSLLESDVDKKLEQVKSSLKKTDLSQDDESLVTSTLQQFEDGTKKVNADLDDFDKQLAGLNETEIVSAEEIDDMVKMVDMFCSNIESCKQNLNKISTMFEGDISATQARKLEKQIKTLQDILKENQTSVNGLVEKLEQKLNVAKSTASVDKTQIEKIETVLNRLKNLSVEIKTEDLAAAKDSWKTRFIASQKKILDNADISINVASKFEQNLKVSGEKLKELNQKTLTNSIYGVKTAVDKNVKGLNDLNNEIKTQIALVEKRMTALTNLKDDLKNDTDQDLVAVCAQAQAKVDELNKKKAFILAAQIKVEELLEEYKNLKLLVTVTDIKLEVQKITSSTMFATNLTGKAEDIKFLALVIANVKAVDKLQKTLETNDIVVEESTKEQLEKFKTDLPDYLSKMMQFVKDNYNCFNTCTDEKIKEKYYSKIADYANIDHSVVFTMPEGLMGADEQTETTTNI